MRTCFLIEAFSPRIFLVAFTDVDGSDGVLIGSLLPFIFKAVVSGVFD